MIHNETFNIWTHLLSCIYFIYQLYLLVTAGKHYGELEMGRSFFIMSVSVLPAIFCMGTSTLYHLYNVLGPKEYELLLRLDLIGIGLMIFSLAIGLIYTALYNT
jgi:predicted membrane channel-forming protein YqfA (hemolysin III family)